MASFSSHNQPHSNDHGFYYIIYPRDYYRLRYLLPIPVLLSREKSLSLKQKVTSYNRNVNINRGSPQHYPLLVGHQHIRNYLYCYVMLLDVILKELSRFLRITEMLYST